MLYVDDIIIIGSASSFITEIVSQLGASFAFKNFGSLNYFLGLQIEYTDSSHFVYQSKYAQDFLRKFNMLHFKPCSNPCASNHHFVPALSPLLTIPIAYSSLVGALQYITFTRPNLSYAMQEACQFMSKPTQHNLIAAKRILKYLKGSLHMGIYFQAGPLSLSAYCDADWAGDPIHRRSITGMVVFFGGSPITWSAKKQPTVSRSSTEVEYRSLAITTTELFWLRMLLKDLGVYLYHPPILWCDNVSALALASNLIFHAHSKHIGDDYHFVRRSF